MTTTITINACFANGTVHTSLNSKFTVDTTFIEPKITIISLQNQTTYNTNDIKVFYNVNSRLIWSYYALDGDSAAGNDWQQFAGNMTLKGLS